MANKGRVYERAYFRDLTLKPGSWAYHPKRWVWRDFTAAWVWGAQFLPGPHVLEIKYDPYPTGVIVWEKDLGLGIGGSEKIIRLTYRLTHQANMATLEFKAGEEIGPYNYMPAQNVGIAYPYDAFSGPWLTPPFNVNIFPGRGVLEPKKW